MGRSPGLAPFSRVIGQPEISTDGFHSYRVAIRDAFGDSASHGSATGWVLPVVSGSITPSAPATNFSTIAAGSIRSPSPISVTS